MHCVEKERDTFPTTYAKEYVRHNFGSKVKLFTSPDAFALTTEEQKAFIDLHAIKKIPWDEQLEIIKNLYAQRMKTTYFVSYCEKATNKPDTGAEEEEMAEDILLTSADKLYSAKSQKILQPLPTSRRVLGYCRPAYYYTGLTEYQDEFGKLGYQQMVPSRERRFQQRLTFCDKFISKH